VIRVDITCDLNDEDETGLPFAFVDEAADPSLIFPGAIVVAGNGKQYFVGEKPLTRVPSALCRFFE